MLTADLYLFLHPPNPTPGLTPALPLQSPFSPAPSPGDHTGLPLLSFFLYSLSPIPQLRQAFPGSQQATLAREAGRPASDLLSHSSPPYQPPSLIPAQQQTSSYAPISRALSRSSHFPPSCGPLSIPFQFPSQAHS